VVAWLSARTAILASRAMSRRVPSRRNRSKRLSDLSARSSCGLHGGPELLKRFVVPPDGVGVLLNSIFLLGQPALVTPNSLARSTVSSFTATSPAGLLGHCVIGSLTH